MLRKTNAPTVHTLQKLCNGFGITLEQFFALDNPAAQLTSEEQSILNLWDTLDETSQSLAMAYMRKTGRNKKYCTTQKSVSLVTG